MEWSDTTYETKANVKKKKKDIQKTTINEPMNQPMN